MGARIISTLALWAIAAAAIIFGKSAGFSALICALALAANAEICALLRGAEFKPALWYIQLATAAMFAAAAAMENPCNYFFAAPALAAVCLPILVSAIKDPFGDYFKKTVLPSVAVIFICPFMLQFYALMSTGTSAAGGIESVMFALWIIAAAKFSDVGAYVVGCAFGRHKMAATISPNKTWEGALGGVASAAAIGAAFAWLGGKYGVFWAEISPAAAALASIPVGITAIVSDLIESIFKRRMGVKDSGKAIPGIGGALDLADSLILCAPMGIAILTIFSLLK